MRFYKFLIKDKSKILHFLDLSILLLISSAAATFFLNFVLWMSFHNSFRISFANTLFLFTRNMTFPVSLLNMFYMIGLQLLIFIFVRKFFTSEIIFWVFIGITSIAEYYKIQDRKEPVLPGDLTSTNNLSQTLQFLPPIAITLSIIALVLIVFLCIKIYKKDYTVLSLWWENIIAGIFVLVAVLTFINRPSQKVNNAFYYLGDYTRYKFDATLDSSTNGMAVSFANNLIRNVFSGNKYVQKNYSEECIRQITNKYAKYANQINKTRKVKSFKGQTVIYVLGETYTRPANVPRLKLDQNATPFMDSVLKNNLSGRMVSAGYGGGTANMEYMVLTSMSYSFFTPQLETPFIQVVPHQKVVPGIADYFQTKIAIHPFLANYYNRPDVFKQMNYDYFYNTKSDKPLQNLQKIENGRYYSDQSAFDNTVARITRKNKSQFIECITMQNHMPYATDEYSHNFKVLAPHESKRNKLAQESYIQGLNYTDQALQRFLDQLDLKKRPITVVFYGDHWPGIFQFMPPVGNRKIQTHLTDYFIWQNKAAKKHNGTHEVKKSEVVAPNEFTPMMLQYNNVQVSPFYAMMTKVHNQLPAIAQWDRHNSNIKFVNHIGLDDEGNNLVDQKSLSKKQLKLLHEYQLIQYDLTAGKQYSVSNNFYKTNK